MQGVSLPREAERIDQELARGGDEDQKLFLIFFGVEKRELFSL